MSDHPQLAVTVLTVPARDAELAADVMMQAGAFAIEERALADGVVELRAPLGDQATKVADRLGGLSAGWEWRIELVDSAPLDTWRAFAAPVQVTADLMLRPAWLAAVPADGVEQIAIEPGAAFGLGDHPTTRLSAAAAWRLVRPGDSVLDVGCGTGVLSVIAGRRRASVVVAIDIAEEAVKATDDNAARNGVEHIVHASTQALADVEGVFDVVLANILAPTLVEMAADLQRVTKPDGVLVVSGLMSGRFDHVVDALRPMVVGDVCELDGWVSVELRHRG